MNIINIEIVRINPGNCNEIPLQDPVLAKVHILQEDDYNNDKKFVVEYDTGKKTRLVKITALEYVIIAKNEIN